MQSTIRMNYAGLQLPPERKPEKPSTSSLENLLCVFRSMQDFKNESEPTDDNFARFERDYSRIAEQIGNRASTITSTDYLFLVDTLPKSEFTGVFLSAVLNHSPIEYLEGIFNQEVFGYRLARGKTIVALEGSLVCHFGRATEGNIVNYGVSEFIADKAVSGVQINCGQTNYFANSAVGGVQANYSVVKEDLGIAVKGGLQENFGTVDCIGCVATGGIQINHNEMREMYCNDGCTQINFGSGGRIICQGLGINKGKLKFDSCKHVTLKHHPEAWWAVEQIRTLSEAPKSLKTAKEILEYNWKEHASKIHSLNATLRGMLT